MWTKMCRRSKSVKAFNSMIQPWSLTQNGRKVARRAVIEVNYKWTRNVGFLHKKCAQFSELNTMIATQDFSSRCMYNMLHHGAGTVYIYFVCAQCNYDKAIPWNELTSVRTTTEQHSSLLFFSSSHKTTFAYHLFSTNSIFIV